jgi:hypothetical protein
VRRARSPPRHGAPRTSSASAPRSRTTPACSSRSPARRSPAAAINASAGPTPVGHLGWVAGKTDDVDAEIDEVALGKLPWLSVAGVPTGGRIFGEIGFVIPTALTARQYFFGLTDDETEGTGTNGSLNITGTTTVVDVATDAAGFIFSSLATSPTHFHMANTNANTQAYIADSGLVGSSTTTRACGSRSTSPARRTSTAP